MLPCVPGGLHMGYVHCVTYGLHHGWCRTCPWPKDACHTRLQKIAHCNRSVHHTTAKHSQLGAQSPFAILWHWAENRLSVNWLEFLHRGAGLVVYGQVYGTDCCKVPCYRPGCGPKGGRGIAMLFQDLGARRGWGVSITPRPHFTPGKDPVPIVQEAGWAPGPVWPGEKSRPHRDSIPGPSSP